MNFFEIFVGLLLLAFTIGTIIVIGNFLKIGMEQEKPKELPRKKFHPKHKKHSTRRAAHMRKRKTIKPIKTYNSSQLAEKFESLAYSEMNCNGCGSKNPSDSIYCTNCGITIKFNKIPTNQICAECGQKNSHDAKNCIVCGVKL
ncbi:hypothetical protein LCGC14_0176230 [marine sediment metagenome]|uniref:DZANK-type domain-containing protein n=1 Tax=marine sediment metagenome TaxID=412755 RepID=A0A0F9UVI8_9ZZZZ